MSKNIKNSILKKLNKDDSTSYDIDRLCDLFKNQDSLLTKRAVDILVQDGFIKKELETAPVPIYRIHPSGSKLLKDQFRKTVLYIIAIVTFTITVIKLLL